MKKEIEEKDLIEMYRTVQNILGLAFLLSENFI
jgi:hypothetical protein